MRSSREDADFVNVIGMHWRGRPEIEARHADVHRTIFRNSKLRMLEQSLRPLGPGIVLAHIQLGDDRTRKSARERISPKCGRE